MSNRIGIDVGGTKIDAAVLSPAGAMLFDKRIATPQSYDALIAAIAGLVSEAQGVAGEGTTVGLGAPGSQSPRTGLWRNANLTFCNDRPFAQDLQAAIALPLKAENDANCFALSRPLTRWAVRWWPSSPWARAWRRPGHQWQAGGWPNAEAAEFGHAAAPADASNGVTGVSAAEGCAERLSPEPAWRDWRRYHGQRDCGQGPGLRGGGQAALLRLQDRFGSAPISSCRPDICDRRPQ
jgi:hypothetical protein